MSVLVRLVNVTDLLAAAGITKMSQEEMILALTSGPDEKNFYAIGSGKGGRVMVLTSDQDWAIEMLQAYNGGQRKRTKRLVLAGNMVSVQMEYPIPRERPLPFATIEEFRNELAEQKDKLMELESLFLETDGRVDKLHVAVEGVNATYKKLRDEVDPKHEMPEPPTLPPKYRWKVLIAGSDRKAVEHLRANFREISFVHVGDEANMSPRQFHNLPHVDVALVMTSYCRHSVMNAVKAKYPEGIVHYVKGGTSSAEGILSLWQRQKQEGRL